MSQVETIDRASGRVPPPSRRHPCGWPSSTTTNRCVLASRRPSSTSGHDFVLAASNVDELVAGLGGREVDVVVLDLSLGDGSTVTDNVKRVQAAGAAVLVHSIADRVALVREALAAGAAGVIPKSSSTRTVIAAATTVGARRGS